MPTSRIPAVLALALMLFAALLPGVARAQGNDAFTSVESIIRFMTSENYSKEDLVRRLAWTDKLVNEIVNYTPSPDFRQRYLELLDIAIQRFQDENIRLRILLRAVTTLDPLVRRYFPQWVVQDEAMILEIMRKIRDNRDDLRDNEAVEIADRVLTGKARIRVVQSPRDQENLIAVIIEKARAKSPNNAESAGFITNAENGDFEDYRIVGRRALQDVLSRDLYDKVVARSEYAHLMETGVIKPEAYVAEANIGIPFGGGFMWNLEADEPNRQNVAVQISRIRAGFELKIGNEWVNLPFLYGPQWNALFVYEPSPFEYVKIGPSIPFSWGDESIDQDLPLFKHRKLVGTWGATGEYWKQLSNIGGSAGVDADGIGAAAFVSFGLKTLGNRKITNAAGEIINGDGMKSDLRAFKEDLAVYPKTKSDLQRQSFYFLTSTATAFYWRDLGFMLDGLRLAVGFGYEKVNEARREFYELDGIGVSPVNDILRAQMRDTVKVLSGKGVLDPFARLSYDHKGKTTYGAAIQYFNGGLMGEAYIHIFSWMRAEVKYSRIVFRDPEVWEHQEMIVPGIRLGFAF